MRVCREPLLSPARPPPPAFRQVVEPKRRSVDAEVRQADASAAAARSIKEECEAILSEALPALQAAIQVGW